VCLALLVSGLHFRGLDLAALAASSIAFVVCSSEQLAHHHRSHGGEQGDAKGGEGVLALGHREAGDHAGAEAGHGQLCGEGGALFHGEPKC